MIFIRLNHRPMAAAPGAAGSGLDLEEDRDDGDGLAVVPVDPDPADPAIPEDRGDVVTGEPDPLAAAVKDGAAALAEAKAGEVKPGEVKPNSPFVPIARLNESLAQTKKLQGEIDRLNTERTAAPVASPAPTAAPAAPAFNELEAETSYGNLLAEGEFAKAAQLRLTINENLRSQVRTSYREEQAEQTAVATLQDVANKAVADYPYLDTAEGADTMAMIVDLRNANVQRGVPYAQALQQAVDKIAPKFAPAGWVPPGKDSTPVVPAVDTRSKAAVARGILDAARQPPVATAAGAGNRATDAEPNPEGMTDAQFEAMTPDQKAKARGDLV